MIITCPHCDKLFEVDEIKIPFNGRLLQCGSCNKQWFYKKEESAEELANITLEKSATQEDFETIIEEESKNLSNVNKEVIQKKHLKKFKIGKYLNIFIVIIVSLLGIILILDTFKMQLSNVLPNLDALLNNLYETLKDIKLFIYDLF